jgi:hypothetical protein
MERKNTPAAQPRLFDQFLESNRGEDVAGRRVLLTPSIRRFVIAGAAAGLAVHEAVGANANIDYRLAEAAIFLALAAVFRHFALRATVFGGAGSCGHAVIKRRHGGGENVPLVTAFRQLRLGCVLHESLFHGLR